MKEQLVTFETAKLAKEKGFNESCNISYLLDFNNSYYIVEDNIREYSNAPLEDDMYYAPTQSLLQKWLREEYNIHIKLEYAPNRKIYLLDVYKTIEDLIDGELKKLESDDYNAFNSYEEALECGLQEALNLI